MVVVVIGKDLVGRDTFCVVVCNPITDVCDTTIIVVVVPPTPDTIYQAGYVRYYDNHYYGST
ncbi:MAG: hypothetical protein IPH74_00845 [Bacteroidetes bacterium]|nr:hypothetical protein [Bacteroidota bacterium]